MKRLLLLSSLALLTICGQSQIIFNVESPVAIGGEYDFGLTSTTGWGVPDMTIPANAIIDTLAFVDDGTAADSLSCNPLVNDLTGKIAVLYRGSCEFGTKAFNAQNAGAVGVIIINIAPGVVPMGGGTDGPNVTIPVWMISSDDGANIRAQMDAGNDVVVFFGTKNGLYADDIGFNQEHMLRAPNATTPQILAQNASEFDVNVGSWIHNYGTNDQTGVTLTCDITFGGANIYSQTSAPVSILSGDSAFVTLPTFSQSTYAVGYYGMDYYVSYGATDQYMSDNSRSSDFSITDNVFSYCPLDSATGIPAGSNARRSVGVDLADEQRFCVAFSNPNASRIAVTGLTFAGSTAPVSGVPLDGEYIEGQVYTWDDSFTGLSDPNFAMSNLNLIESGDYTYLTDLQNVNVTLDFFNTVTLLDNQRYLFCISVYSANFQIATNGTLDYNENLNIYDEAYTPIYGTGSNGAQWFALGFGTDVVPTMSLNIIDTAALGINTPNTEAMEITPFPNPAQNEINIPFGDNEGLTSISIYDVTGKLISTQAVTINNNSLVTVNVTDIPNGTYVFTAIFENGNATNFNVVISK